MLRKGGAKVLQVLGMRRELLPDTVATPCALGCLRPVDDRAFEQLCCLPKLQIAAGTDDAKVAHAHMRGDMTADLEYVAVPDTLTRNAASNAKPIAVTHLQAIRAAN